MNETVLSMLQGSTIYSEGRLTEIGRWLDFDEGFGYFETVLCNIEI